MGHGGNNAVPHVHQRKHFMPSCTHKGNFRVHLDQPMKKAARRRNRLEKARKAFPRPLATLRPSVACPTIRYNMKRRLGGGFSFEELKAAEIHPRFARTVGIAVDARRKNTSEEGLKLNVQRLKTYMSKLVVFPLNHKKVQKGEASEADCKAATQDRSRFGKSVAHPSAKAVKEAVLPTQKLTKDEKKKKVFKFLKNAISAERFFGQRIRKAEKKAEAAAKKK
jgi:large subunit ribosomal protein L13e